jgi:hypothetical protein
MPPQTALCSWRGSTDDQTPSVVVGVQPSRAGPSSTGVISPRDQPSAANSVRPARRQRLAVASNDGRRDGIGLELVEQPLLLGALKVAQIRGGRARPSDEVGPRAFGQAYDLSLPAAVPVFKGVRVGRIARADRRAEAVAIETGLEQIRPSIALDGLVTSLAFIHGVSTTGQGNTATGGDGKSVTGGAPADGSRGRLLQSFFQLRDAVLEERDVILVEGIERLRQSVTERQSEVGEEPGDRHAQRRRETPSHNF